MKKNESIKRIMFCCRLVFNENRVFKLLISFFCILRFVIKRISQSALAFVKDTKEIS